MYTLVCYVCNEIFSTTRNLKVHMRIHTGKKLHKCSICTKTFTQNTNLKHYAFVCLLCQQKNICTKL